MGILDNELPTVPLIPTLPYQYYYALGIEPATGYLYVGDPKGFTQKGTVSIYKQDGTLIKSFVTGLGPGQIYFGE
jgi:DNA-binding beta-propeller fold protein YncE